MGRNQQNLYRMFHHVSIDEEIAYIGNVMFFKGMGSCRNPIKNFYVVHFNI